MTSASVRRVWYWQALPTWQEEVWHLLSDVVDSHVITEFRRTPPEFIVSDDLSWLDDIVRKVTGREVDTKDLLANRLLERYDAIRAFHGARPIDVERYYKEGLLLLDAERFEASVRSIFLSGSFPELTLTHVDNAIQAVGRDLRERRLYFEANERLLIDYCAHYMLYGSEYMVGIAAHIKGHRDYRQVLKQRGTPTVFVCDVPLNYMHPSAVAEFAGMALEVLFESLLEADYSHPSVGRGGGICLQRPLSPDCIVCHYHPQEIKDPLS